MLEGGDRRFPAAAQPQGEWILICCSGDGDKMLLRLDAVATKKPRWRNFVINVEGRMCLGLPDTPKLHGASHRHRRKDRQFYVGTMLVLDLIEDPPRHPSKSYEIVPGAKDISIEAATPNFPYRNLINTQRPEDTFVDDLVGDRQL